MESFTLYLTFHMCLFVLGIFELISEFEIEKKNNYWILDPENKSTVGLALTTLKITLVAGLTVTLQLEINQTKCFFLTTLYTVFYVKYSLLIIQIFFYW